MESNVLNKTWLEIDEFVQAFELAWIDAASPEIADFLPEDDHSQFETILLELVRVDIELRWKRHCQKTLESYCSEFPQLFDNEGTLGLVAFEEFRARREAGESVPAADYANRWGILTENWPIASEESLPALVWSDNRLGPDRFGNRFNSPTPMAFPEVGTQLLSFHLESELGRGTFSRVYLARQGDLANRHVVLKVSAESFSEADKLAQLQHANIVPIYSVHRLGDLSAVCMPYFGATTLADVIQTIHKLHRLPPSGRAIVETLSARGRQTDLWRAQINADAKPVGSRDSPEGSHFRVADEGDLPGRRYDGRLKILSGLGYVEAVLWIGSKLAEGLQHAHERGILHRDLKPANVLLADDGQPMLLDFNLSADLKQNGHLRASLVGGTLPYMAPEQIDAYQNRTQVSDPRSDIYSVGVILFELLTGRSPFPDVDVPLSERLLANMIQARKKPPAKLRALNPAITPAVEAIVHQCLSPHPDRRYQAVAELHEDLDRHSKQLPLRHAREPSASEQLHKWFRRHSRLVSFIGALLFVLAVTFAVRAYREHKRIESVLADIDRLMISGRQAVEENQADVAHGRFLAAWMKVQGEPALINHQLGVAGWLDHSRQEVAQRQWRQRIPPREYDEKRDEAFLLSLMLEPRADEQFALARNAIHAAFELTIPGDPGWTQERAKLTLVEADLIEMQIDADDSLNYLDATDEFSSRLFHERRSALLERIGRGAEAEEVRKKAAEFPPDPSLDHFFAGMDRIRHREFDLALDDFDFVLNHETDSFIARLFQAICFLNLDRSREAKVGLTACIAQRPQFLWSWQFRARANVELEGKQGAVNDLNFILERKPSESLERATLQMMKLIESN